ncbi:4-hydroxy-tetrahydrodipicolinate synthase [Virgibacillus sp. W0430]|uniref:4-hydroxy-tetrahydrodipicolinate synthase n=1 Tax=Virgibacillus sp. W0430 TaxID=3391580 RepID=UPI003F47F79B
MNFGNVITAMVTPFGKDEKIDLNETARLVDYLLANGTDGLVIAGTTGESATLSFDEKIELMHHVVSVVNNRVPVLAGTGCNSTKSTVSLTKKAEEAGVDGIMLVTPYYNKPNQEGLYKHFTTIASETSLPIMLYNNPGRCSVNIEAETTIRLSFVKNIVSTKEASGNLEQVADIIEQKNDGFTVYSGDDGMTIPMMSIGADGVVSVASHIIGNEMNEMVQFYKSGNVQKAAALHRSLLPIMRGLFQAPSPAPLKKALLWKGINAGGVRLPLVSLSNEETMNLRLLLETKLRTNSKT